MQHLLDQPDLVRKTTPLRHLIAAGASEAAAERIVRDFGDAAMEIRSTDPGYDAPLRCSTSYALGRAGKIPAVKLGHYRRFDPPEVIEAVQKMRLAAPESHNWPLRVTEKRT